MLRLSDVPDPFADDEEPAGEQSAPWWITTNLVLVSLSGTFGLTLVGLAIRDMQKRELLGSDSRYLPLILLCATLSGLVFLFRVAGGPVAGWVHRRKGWRRQALRVGFSALTVPCLVALWVGYDWLHEWNERDLNQTLGRANQTVATGSMGAQVAQVLGSSTSGETASPSDSVPNVLVDWNTRYQELEEKTAKRAAERDKTIEDLQRQVRELQRRPIPQLGSPIQQAPATAGRGSPVGEAPPPPPPNAATLSRIVPVGELRLPTPTISVSATQAKEALQNFRERLTRGRLLRDRLLAQPTSDGTSREAGMWSDEITGQLRGGVGALSAAEFTDLVGSQLSAIERVDAAIGYLELLVAAIEAM